MADNLLAERLTNLPPDRALPAGVDILVSADPGTWDRLCQDISDQLSVDEAAVRKELHHAVRTWNDDPRRIATVQLNNISDLRARLREASRAAPDHRWLNIAAQVDPHLPGQDDWPALAHMMQNLHDEGHDVQALVRNSVAEEPLSPAHPAQDLCYRLISLAPPTREAIPRPESGRSPARPKDERAGLVLDARPPKGPRR